MVHEGRLGQGASAMLLYVSAHELVDVTYR
jgi:hypothetical protein